MTKMSPSIFMILTNFMLDLDTWTPWDAVQTTPGMSIGPPFITGKKISSGIFRFWQRWLVTSGSAAKKQENNERTGKSEEEIITDAEMWTFSPPTAFSNVSNQNHGFVRNLLHFLDLESVENWAKDKQEE